MGEMERLCYGLLMWGKGMGKGRRGGGSVALELIWLLEFLGRLDCQGRKKSRQCCCERYGDH